MALLMYLNKERFRPENPLIFDNHLSDDVFMSFVDFIPSVTKRSTTAAMTAGEVEYHNFREIIDLANSWLERNPNWTVFNCETVMLYYKFNDKMSYYELKPNDSNFYIYGSEKNNVLKALRMWVKRKRGRDKQYIDVQTLNYYDILPEQLNDYGKFENLDHLLARANQLIANKEVQGNLITVESLICESSGAAWRIEPDVTLSAVSSKKMIVLRLFYQENLITTDSSLGIIDFIPRHLSGGGLFKRPKYEPFDDVLARAYVWLAENESVRLVNLKTLDIKLKSWTEIDTKIMHYHEHGCYIRILRLAYARKSIVCSPNKLDSKQQPCSSSSSSSSSKKTTNNSSLKLVTFDSLNSSTSSESGACMFTPNEFSSSDHAFDKESENCYIHNKQLQKLVQQTIETMNLNKMNLNLDSHPDDETLPANEEEARKQENHNQRILQASKTCRCTNVNLSTNQEDENLSSINSSNNLSYIQSDEQIQRESKPKHKQVKHLFLNSKYFTPLRKNETIQQIQIRIHEFVNSMLTIKNPNITSSSLTKHVPSTDGSRLFSYQNEMNNTLNKYFNIQQQNLLNHHLQPLNTRSNRTLSTAGNSLLSEHGNLSRKLSSNTCNSNVLLVDQDVHCNVICAETINIFCKSIETDLNAEQNETFQFNRFGTRNGYLLVTFRIYFDYGNDAHIQEYKIKQKNCVKQPPKTIKLNVQEKDNQLYLKQELLDKINFSEHSKTKTSNTNFSNKTNETTCKIS